LHFLHPKFDGDVARPRSSTDEFHMIERRQVVARFRDLLRADDVPSALRYLNSVGVHRFTALFRFDGGTLRNLYLIDRQDESVDRCPDLPVLDSYCVYVRDSASKFMTEHARTDSRVAGHPKQQSVQSYCGFPLLEPNGNMFGTICHFDYEPVPFDEDEQYLLETVAPSLIDAILRTEHNDRMGRAS
jgi:GAF domain-containing protein